MKYLAIIGLSCMGLVACNPSSEHNEMGESEETPAYDPAQSEDLTEEESIIPQEVKDAFEAKYGNEKVDWNRDDNGFFEGRFKKDGVKYRADFSPIGEWVETENSVKYDDLPVVLQQFITTNYDKSNVAELEHVDHHDKGEFYDLEFKQEGKNHDVEITPEGEVLTE